MKGRPQSQKKEFSLAICRAHGVDFGQGFKCRVSEKEALLLAEAFNTGQRLRDLVLNLKLLIQAWETQ